MRIGEIINMNIPGRIWDWDEDGKKCKMRYWRGSIKITWLVFILTMSSNWGTPIPWFVLHTTLPPSPPMTLMDFDSSPFSMCAPDADYATFHHSLLLLMILKERKDFKEEAIYVRRGRISLVNFHALVDYNHFPSSTKPPATT